MTYSTNFGIRTHYGWFKRLLLKLPRVSTTIDVEISSNNKIKLYPDDKKISSTLTVFKSNTVQNIPIEYCLPSCMSNLYLEVKDKDGKVIPMCYVRGFDYGEYLCRAILKRCTLTIRGVIK